MKRLLTLSLPLAVLLFAFAVPSAHAQEEDPEPPSNATGKWRTIDETTGQARSIVEIYEEGGTLSGQVVQLLNVRSEAPRNEDGEVVCALCEGPLEGQPIEGMVILEGMEEDVGEWNGGTIVDPESGKTYEVIMTLRSEDRLKVHGYDGSPLFGRTQTWVRVRGE